MGTHDALCLDRRVVGLGASDCICVAQVEILNRIQKKEPCIYIERSSQTRSLVRRAKEKERKEKQKKKKQDTIFQALTLI